MKTKSYLLLLILSIPSFAIAQTGTTIPGTVFSGGVTRSYLMYLPAKYNFLVPVPLIFDIHGWTGTSAKQEVYADFRKIADTANFIIVLPQALTAPGNPPLPSWDLSGTSDEDFLISVLDTVESQYNINPGKIYSTGFSQGGVMSYDLACYYSSRFAAIASVSGGLDSSNIASCSPIHPMPTMEIHGTADSLAVYTGSSISVDVDTLVNYWVRFNNCNPKPAIDTLPNINKADSCYPVHYTYTGGNGGASVELYKIIGGGHAWPSDTTTADSYGAGNRCLDFSASQQIWQFFSKYSLNILNGIETIVPKNNDVSVYPNPSNGTFTIALENYQNTSIKIINVLGETIFEEKITSPSTLINLGNIPSGIYFYQVRKQTNSIKSGKIIVQ